MEECMSRGTKKLEGNIIKHKSGLWIWEGTCDIYVPGQVKDYALLSLEGKTVLDLGAHIGAFSKKAIQSGASQVIAVEPLEDNYVLFTRNLEEYENVTLIPAAVVGSICTEETRPFWLCMGDTSAHSLVQARGRTEVVVNTVKINTLLEMFNPEVVKVDIEGAEYDVLNKMINDGSIHYIKKLFVEFRWDKLNMVKEDHDNLINKLKNIKTLEILPETYRYFKRHNNEIVKKI